MRYAFYLIFFTTLVKSANATVLLEEALDKGAPKMCQQLAHNIDCSWAKQCGERKKISIKG